MLDGAQTATTNSFGWIETETVQSRLARLRSATATPSRAWPNACVHGRHARRRRLAVSVHPARRVGGFLDGAKTYRLRLPPDIPAKNFWSVVMYDADSRSIARNGQPFPSVGTSTHPKVDNDGSITVVFGPDRPQGGANWTRTAPGKGWFVPLRFCGPLEPLFDKSWRPEDIVEI